MRDNKEPSCQGCYVSLDIENRKAWRLYSLCRNQVLRAGIDGTVVGLDLAAVIGILKFYKEDEKMFDDMLICWNAEQEEEI